MIKKLLVGILVSGIALSLPMSVVKADEFALPDYSSQNYYEEIEELNEMYIPEPQRDTDIISSGIIKALVVRVGFRDYPINSTNRNYNFYNDEYLKALYEGKDEGFGLPYNGLSDYLNTSSYGKLSMSIGRIIDIQMDDSVQYYTDGDGFISFYENDEFLNKLYKEINVSDYDSNNDGIIDALYIWNVGPEISEEVGGYYSSTYDEDLHKRKSFIFMQIPEEIKDDEVKVLNCLIHETGHWLGLYDYYILEGYPLVGRADIGNIMGAAADNEMGDFDAWSKWKADWLSKKNVISVMLADGDKGTIKLTPYDSDTTEGKKIALLDYGDYYIAVDYCAGINNNGFDTKLRTTGFRFYYIIPNYIKSIYHDNNPDLAPEGLYFAPEEELGAYQLFADNDEIADLLPENELKTLRIFDIKTGDNPEFSYSFTDDTIIETEPDVDVFKSLDYRVKIIDGKGNILNEGTEISYYDVTETGFVTANPMGNSRCLVFIHDENTSSTDTILRLESVPEGYKMPSDIRLHAEAIDKSLFDVTSDSENVLISTDSTREGDYLITVLLEELSDTPSRNDDEAVLPPLSIISYKVSVLDDTGNDVTDDVEIIFDDITDTDSYINHYVGDDSHILNLGFSYDLPQVDTKINLSAVPDGYIASDIVVNMVKNSDNSGHTVTSSNANVEVIEDVAGIYEIKITLQKEQQEETAQQSDDAIQSSDDNTQGTEEITETSDDATQPEQEITEPSDDATQLTEETKESSDGEKTGSTDEQTTTSEEIKNNDNAKESSSSEESVKKPTETVSRNSSGNDTKVSVFTPKAEGKESKNSVTDSVEKNPETGDRSNTPLRITIAGASAGVLATAVIARKRKQS